MTVESEEMTEKASGVPKSQYPFAEKLGLNELNFIKHEQHLKLMFVFRGTTNINCLKLKVDLFLFFFFQDSN